MISSSSMSASASIEVATCARGFQSPLSRTSSATTAPMISSASRHAFTRPSFVTFLPAFRAVGFNRSSPARRTACASCSSVLRTALAIADISEKNTCVASFFHRSFAIFCGGTTSSLGTPPSDGDSPVDMSTHASEIAAAVSRGGGCSRSS